MILFLRIVWIRSSATFLACNIRLNMLPENVFWMHFSFVYLELISFLCLFHLPTYLDYLYPHHPKNQTQGPQDRFLCSIFICPVNYMIWGRDILHLCKPNKVQVCVALWNYGIKEDTRTVVEVCYLWLQSLENKTFWQWLELETTIFIPLSISNNVDMPFCKALLWIWLDRTRTFHLLRWLFFRDEELYRTWG